MKAKRFRLNNDLTIIKLKLNIKSGFHSKNQKFLKSFFFLLYIVLAFISPTYSFSTEKEFPLKTPDSSAVIYVAPTTFIYEVGQNDVNISDVIYVAPGTTIFGTLSAQEINIPKLPKTVEKKTTTSDMRNALGLSKEFVPQKKIKNKIVQRFQDQLNLDVKNTKYLSISNSSIPIFVRSEQNTAAIGSSASKFTFGVVEKAHQHIIFEIIQRISKQEFYISLNYIEFFKFRNTVLRGPPFTTLQIIV